MAKFIIGGRMGDLIHQMYVVKNTPGQHELYITDRRDLHSDGFIYPLQQTIEELRPVLEYQGWTVQAYEGEFTEAIEARHPADYINLNMWRRYVYSASWTNLLAKTFNVPVVGEAWLKSPLTVRHNKIVHCSIPEPRKGNRDGINLHGCVFMGSLEEYRVFNRPELPHIVPHSLAQMFSLIASCGSFIGNQSLPLAIAHALDVPRLAVLNTTDAKAYIGEELIFEKFKYVL